MSKESKFQEISQTFTEVDNTYRFSKESFKQGSTFSRTHTLGVHPTTMLFEDMAVFDVFIRDYYTQILLLL